MEYSKLLELIKTISDSNITNFEYEEGNMKLVMSSGEIRECTSDGAGRSKKHSVEAEGNEAESNVEINTLENSGTGSESANSILADSNAKVVKSPLVGTFYSASSEDGEPFVSVGDTVSKGQTLAIVEAMKLMNDIECEYDGIVKEIYVANGESVEYGQPLFAIS